MENNPSGMLTVYGENQLQSLANALTAGANMYTKGVEDGMEADSMISIKAVTKTCFRVEISGLVETEM